MTGNRGEFYGHFAGKNAITDYNLLLTKKVLGY